MEKKISRHDDLRQDCDTPNGARDTVAVESTGLSMSANNASVKGTEFESTFEKLLEGLSDWKGVQVKVSDCIVMSRLLCECENIVKSKSTVAVQQTDVHREHTLIQRASRILHDLVCLHTPGTVLIVY